MNERIAELLRKPWVVPTSVGVASFGIGAAVGYFIANRRWAKVAEEIMDECNRLVDENVDLNNTLSDLLSTKQLEFDLDAVNKQLPKLPERDETPRPIGLIELDHPAIANPHWPDIVTNPKPNPEDIMLASTEESEDDTDEAEVVNIFSQRDNTGWDYEAELAQRNTTEPYVIHRDEYFNQEMGYGQSTLTYYEGDDILTDEHDAPIYDVSNIVGEMKFGHGSGDQNLVFIRNDRLHAEYEIVRDPGMYQVEVLGLQIEKNMEAADLKHSKHHVGKFRQE